MSVGELQEAFEKQSCLDEKLYESIQDREVEIIYASIFLVTHISLTFGYLFTGNYQIHRKLLKECWTILSRWEIL